MSGLLVKTVRREGGGGDGPSVPARPHLFLVLECSRPLAGGARFALDGVQEVRIGRGVERTFARSSSASSSGGAGGVTRLDLRVPDPLMSSSHARLLGTPYGWALEDAGSTNGSFVDGRRVTTRTVLEDGAIVELGSSLFVVQRALPTPEGTADDAESRALTGREHGLATLIPSYAASLAAFTRVAASSMPVLLLGESGSGKEVLARAVHTLSGRRGAFVPVNCGALPASLVEGQLFGHVKGAFSGAVRDEPGLVRASSGGTLFLDEVGDLPAAAQASLLRVLQEGEVVPVGATRAVKVDLRVVAATHRRIDAPEADSGFRRDLYARLAGFTHEVLALRDRREDFGLLVAELLLRVAPDPPRVRFGVELGRALLAYDWPLNVRELQHALAAAAVLAGGGPIDVAHLPVSLRDALGRPRTPAAKRASRAPAPLSPADEEIRTSLVAALSATRGNVSEVARSLGRTRMQIHRWMNRFGIDVTTFR